MPAFPSTLRIAGPPRAPGAPHASGPPHAPRLPRAPRWPQSKDTAAHAPPASILLAIWGEQKDLSASFENFSVGSLTLSQSGKSQVYLLSVPLVAYTAYSLLLILLVYGDISWK